MARMDQFRPKLTTRLSGLDEALESFRRTQSTIASLHKQLERSLRPIGSLRKDVERLQVRLSGYESFRAQLQASLDLSSIVSLERALNLDVTRALRRADSLPAQIKALSRDPFSKSIQATIENFRSLEKALNRQWSPALASTVAFQHSFNRLLSPSFSGLQAVVDEIARSAEVARALRSGFSTNLLQQIAGENVTFDEAVDLVQGAVEEAVRESPRSAITYQGWVQLVVAVFLFLCSAYLTDRSEKATNERLDELEERLEQKDNDMVERLDRLAGHLMDEIERLRPEPDTSTYYVARRAVALRMGPATQAHAIMTLYPGQVVELVRRDKKWIYVTAFDFVEGLPRTGWVYKKYLRMLPRSSGASRGLEATARPAVL